MSFKSTAVIIRFLSISLRLDQSSVCQYLPEKQQVGKNRHISSSFGIFVHREMCTSIYI